MDSTTVLVRVPTVAWSRLGDEILVLDSGRRRSHRLLETAAFIWERADGKLTLHDLVAELCAAYDVARETAQRDVVEIAEQWKALGIVSVVSV